MTASDVQQMTHDDERALEVRSLAGDPPCITGVLACALECLPEQIAVVDAESDIVWVNRAWLDFAGANSAADVDWIGVNYLASGQEPLHRDGAGDVLDMLREVLSGHRDTASSDYPCHSPTEQRWFHVEMAAITPEGGHRYAVISHHDVTARYIAEQRALRLAFSDPVTGVANRRHFDDFLERQWSQAGRFELPISLIAVDVDDFKSYNDLLGHDVGDKVLSEVARALESICRRPTDLAARVGGDEFAAVLAGADGATAERLAERVRDELRASVAHEGHRNPTVSVGVACRYPTPDRSSDGLVKAADRALLAAKRAGRDRVVLLDADESGETDDASSAAPSGLEPWPAAGG